MADTIQLDRVSAEDMRDELVTLVDIYSDRATDYWSPERIQKVSGLADHLTELLQEK